VVGPQAEREAVRVVHEEGKLSERRVREAPAPGGGVSLPASRSVIKLRRLLDIEFQIVSKRRPIALASDAMSVLRYPLSDTS